MLVAAAVWLAPSRPAAAQTGLLIVAHGAGPEWNQRVREVASEVSWPHGPTALAFLMGPEARSSGWDTAVGSLAARGAGAIVTVPLMVSSHGGHYRQIRHYAGEVDSLPAGLAGHDHRSGAGPHLPMRVTPALDGAPEMVQAVAARWRALAAADRARPVLLVAHGPSDPDDARRWLGDLNEVAAGLGREGLAGDVRSGLLWDDAPAPVRAAAVGQMRDTIRALAARAGDSIVVLPILISSGEIDRTKLPRDFEGLPVRYSAAPLAPLPQLSRWIERVAREALPRLHPPHR